LNIGILALQGDIEEHLILTKLSLDKLNIDGEVRLVKDAKELESLSGLIIPGGESTVIGGLAMFGSLIEALREQVENGLALFGTCAGAIIMAKRTYDKKIGETGQPLLGVIDMIVERNAFGRQKESFETNLSIPVLGEKPFRGIFIRAPVIKEVGANVTVLARLNEAIVAVKQGNHIATAFHPELTQDTRLHEYFITNLRK